MTGKLLWAFGIVALCGMVLSMLLFSHRPLKTSGIQPARIPAMQDPLPEPPPSTEDERATATFGSGCFWCTEGVFQQVRGVQSVISGYSGGHVSQPSYREVCTGTTGHAEVVQITYDPSQVTFAELLEIFWSTHDPTTRNRQGNDVGTQYRSVIFHHNESQRQQAEHYKQQLDESGAFPQPIVTEIAAFAEFYPAENSHQDYFETNPGQPYCRYVIQPKLDKFRKVFQDRLKPE